MVRNTFLIFAVMIFLCNFALAGPLLDEHWCRQNGGFLKADKKNILPPSCYTTDVSNSDNFSKKVYSAFTSAYYASLINNQKPVHLVVVEDYETGIIPGFKGENSSLFNQHIWTITKNELGNYI